MKTIRKLKKFVANLDMTHDFDDVVKLVNEAGFKYTAEELFEMAYNEVEELQVYVESCGELE